MREEYRPKLSELQWLRSDMGRAICAAMAADEPADTPAQIQRWRERIEPWQVSAASAQVTLRRTAAAKFSRANEMLFDRVALEQASDEQVAAHKAKRFENSLKVVDFCCGIGGDATALSQGRELVALDWSDVRVEMAVHNASVYGGNVRGLAGDAAFERPEGDAAHIDPDRRPGGGKRVHDAETSSPDLSVLQSIVRQYQHVAIKLSPGVDYDALPFDAEIELISHHGQCRQAVVWTGRFAQTHRRATVLPSGESIHADSDADLAWPATEEPSAGRLLYEPDPAVIRAHLVGVFARQHGLAPVDGQIAYLVGDAPIDTRLAAGFRILDVAPWSLQAARAWLQAHDVGSLDIKTRGFAAKPEDIFKRLRLSGRRAAVLFLTRIAERPAAILAERL
jgi:hypothetical protein